MSEYHPPNLCDDVTIAELAWVLAAAPTDCDGVLLLDLVDDETLRARFAAWARLEAEHAS